MLKGHADLVEAPHRSPPSRVRARLPRRRCPPRRTASAVAAQLGPPFVSDLNRVRAITFDLLRSSSTLGLHCVAAAATGGAAAGGRRQHGNEPAHRKGGLLGVGLRQPAVRHRAQREPMPTACPFGGALAHGVIVSLAHTVRGWLRAIVEPATLAEGVAVPVAVPSGMKTAPGVISEGRFNSSGDRIRTCDLWVMS